MLQSLRRITASVATAFVGPPQKRAASVWSAVRAVLLFAPSVLTSLKSFAYCELVSGYGAGPPNCYPFLIRNGLTSLTQANGSLTNAGSTGRH